MTKKKSYDEMSVVRSLNCKSSIRITTNPHGQKFIEIARDATDVGNGSWGKIDYLTKVHHYIVHRVARGQVFRKSNNDNTEDNTANNIRVKRNKINMASMVKNTMNKLRK